MTYDPSITVPPAEPASAPIAPMAPMAPVANFALGPPARGGGGATRLLAVVAAVAVVGGGGYLAYSKLAAPAAPAALTPAPAAKPAPPAKAGATDYQVLLSDLRNAATAEESYFIDHRRYTTRLADLRDEGLTLQRGVQLTVVSATARRYCLKAAGAAPLVAYYDSATGRPSRTACR